MYHIIDRETLRQRLESGEPLMLVDALPESVYRKHHLPGAINIPSEEINDRAAELLPDKGAPIAVYCANAPCKRSQRAAERLDAMGYTDVYDYHEGKADWMAAGLPVEEGG